MKLRAALIAACAALPLAFAAPSRAADPGMMLYDAAGRPVAVLHWLRPEPARQPEAAAFAAQPAPALSAIDIAFADLLARQETILARMMAQLRTLAPPVMPLPGPGRTIEVALPGPGAASGTEFVAFSSGRGACTETTTWVDRGDGAGPQVSVRRTGDCGIGGGTRVARPEPEARPSGPTARPRIIDVEYRRPALKG